MLASSLAPPRRAESRLAGSEWESIANSLARSREQANHIMLSGFGNLMTCPRSAED